MLVSVIKYTQFGEINEIYKRTFDITNAVPPRITGRVHIHNKYDDRHILWHTLQIPLLKSVDDLYMLFCFHNRHTGITIEQSKYSENHLTFKHFIVRLEAL